MVTHRSLVFFLLVSISVSAHSEMNLSKSIVELGIGDARRDDVIVFNTGDDTLYVSVEPMQVFEPGTDAERRERITDPEAAGLLVTPNKLIVPPGGRKAVRMVALEPSAQEQIFRVNFTPIAPPLEIEEGQGAQIQVVVAYQVLLMTRPQNGLHSLQASREGQQLVLENTGNSNALLTDGIVCPTAEQVETREGCATLPSRRLYAGNRWVTDLPIGDAGSVVEFTVTGASGSAKQRF